MLQERVGTVSRLPVPNRECGHKALRSLCHDWHHDGKLHNSLILLGEASFYRAPTR
jgi:hypothetical protein